MRPRFRNEGESLFRQIAVRIESAAPAPAARCCAMRCSKAFDLPVLVPVWPTKWRCRMRAAAEMAKWSPVGVVPR